MEKKNVLVLGKDGMLGHKLYQVLKQDYGLNVYGTSRKSVNSGSIFFDPLKNFNDLIEIINDFDIKVVVNCIGILNHQSDESLLVDINSIFPKKLEQLLFRSKTKIIHLSTDCVFNGEKGNYSEQDIPDSFDLYGKSKFLGEIHNTKDLTIRCSIIGPELKNEHNTGLLNWYLKKAPHSSINGFTNVYWSGTSTLKLSQMILYSIHKNLKGLIHVSVPRKISKFNLLQLFNKFSGINIKINPSNEPRYDKSLISDNHQLVIDSSFDVIIQEMFEDISENQSSYNHYKLKN